MVARLRDADRLDVKGELAVVRLARTYVPARAVYSVFGQRVDSLIADSLLTAPALYVAFMTTSTLIIDVDHGHGGVTGWHVRLRALPDTVGVRRRYSHLQQWARRCNFNRCQLLGVVSRPGAIGVIVT